MECWWGIFNDVSNHFQALFDDKFARDRQRKCKIEFFFVVVHGVVWRWGKGRSYHCQVFSGRWHGRIQGKRSCGGPGHDGVSGVLDWSLPSSCTKFHCESQQQLVCNLFLYYFLSAFPGEFSNVHNCAHSASSGALYWIRKGGLVAERWTVWKFVKRNSNIHCEQVRGRPASPRARVLYISQSIGSNRRLQIIQPINQSITCYWFSLKALINQSINQLISSVTFLVHSINQSTHYHFKIGFLSELSRSSGSDSFLNRFWWWKTHGTMRWRGGGWTEPWDWVLV